MFPVGLPEALCHVILSYSARKDHIAVAATCRRGVQDVEAFSKNELDRIEREHNVDDTWKVRIGMQVAGDVARRAAALGQVFQLPSMVSHRRMLHVAYRTYLYSLQASSPLKHCGCLSLAIHPNGKYFLSGHNGSKQGDPTVCLWDLSTQQHIKSYDGLERGAVHVGFSAGHVVALESAGYEHSWQMNGSCRHRTSLQCWPVAVDSSNEEVFVTASAGPVYAYNTTNGVRREMEYPWTDAMEGSRGAYCKELVVCGDCLLHLRAYRTVDRSAGIYVLDRLNLEQRSHLSGDYCSMASSCDGYVVAASFHGWFDVFQLEDGHLIHIRSFHRWTPYPNPVILSVSQSMIFVQAERSVVTGLPTVIEVYNILTGELERRLCFPLSDSVTGTPYIPWCMASSDNELFIGFNLGQWADRADGTIKAFLR